jgi:hypothetical protein
MNSFLWVEFVETSLDISAPVTSVFNLWCVSEIFILGNKYPNNSNTSHRSDVSQNRFSSLTSCNLKF